MAENKKPVNLPSNLFQIFEEEIMVSRRILTHKKLASPLRRKTLQIVVITHNLDL